MILEYVAVIGHASIVVFGSIFVLGAGARLLTNWIEPHRRTRANPPSFTKMLDEWHDQKHKKNGPPDPPHTGWRKK